MSTSASGSSSPGPLSPLRPRSATRATAVSLLAAALLAAGCGSSSDPSGDEATPTTPTTATSATSTRTAEETADPAAGTTPTTTSSSPTAATDAEGAGFAVEAARWEGCGDGFECATVAVPVDHADPGGDTLDLALVRRPAPDRDGSGILGSILVNPGGPGGSGIAYLRGGIRLDPATLDDHHVVGFDPRGVGASAGLTCALPDDVGPLPDLDPDDAEERDELDREARELAERCATQHGSLLPHLSTDAVVDDLDLLRRAVGDERLRYIGLSYGTLIGLRYAERYPDRVGRMILDGVVDPAQTLTGLLAQQADGFDRVFATADASCGQRLTCPDGGLAAGYDRLAARLDTEGPIDGVGPSELAIATLIGLYAESLWPRLAGAVIQAERGDAGGVEALYRLYANAADPAIYNAVVCSDSPLPAGTEAWDRVADDLADRSPRFGAVLANEVRACAHWPVRSTTTPEPVSPVGLAPVLVLTTTGDAATPAENAVAVAGTLDGAGLVTVDDTSHTALGRNGCVTEIVADYLATGQVPPTVHLC